MSMKHVERRIWPPIFVKPVTGPALGDMMTNPKERTRRIPKRGIERPIAVTTPEPRDLVDPVAPIRIG